MEIMPRAQWVSLLQRVMYAAFYQKTHMILIERPSVKVAACTGISAKLYIINNILLIELTRTHKIILQKFENF